MNIIHAADARERLAEFVNDINFGACEIDIAEQIEDDADWQRCQQVARLALEQVNNSIAVYIRRSIQLEHDFGLVTE